MKALLVRNPGPAGVLEQVHVPDPVPAGREVILNVGAVGVNFSDSLVRLGFFGSAARIPGLDIAGTVVDAARQTFGPCSQTPMEPAGAPLKSPLARQSHAVQVSDDVHYAFDTLYSNSRIWSAITRPEKWASRRSWLIVKDEARKLWRDF